MDKGQRRGKNLVPHSIFHVGSDRNSIEQREFQPDVVADEHGNIRESKEAFKQRLMKTLSQMMFVSGEQAEPSAETTYLIEEIVREQVIEMVSIVLRLLSVH